MTTVTQIITDAYRQSNLVAAGAVPTTTQQTEALRYLDRIVKSVFGREVGEELTAFPIGRSGISRPAGYPGWDVVPDSTWFVPKNIRVMLNLDTSTNLYLHPMPSDGTRFAAIDVAGNLATYPVTIHGNGRLIENATSITLNVNNTDSEWFYREDLANWAKYAPLSLIDNFPFPIEFDDFFITMLAMRLNPSYGVSLDQQSLSVFNRSASQIKARYKQAVPIRSEIALTRLSRLAQDRDLWTRTESYYDPTALFERGWPY